MRIRWRRLVGVVLLGLVLITVGQSAATADDEGPFPGLPPTMNPDGWISTNWSGGTQAAVAEVAKQRQWARTPLQLSAVNFLLKIGAPDFDPAVHAFSLTTRNAIYFVAGDGDIHNYGLTPEFTVRTVAFGAVPVEAQVQLEQRRDSHGLPLPIMVDTDSYTFRREHTPPGYLNRVFNDDTEVRDRLFVRVTGLRVDGQDIGLTDGCRTVRPGVLRLRGEGGWDWELLREGSNPVYYEYRRYAAARGGLLEGTIDVNAFTGCVSATGDDLSPLLTAAVSGENNTVRAHLSAVPCGAATSGPGLPPAPGFEPPEQVCNLLEPPKLPQRGE